MEIQSVTNDFPTNWRDIDRPPETETAAPVGAGNGGDQIGKQASNSKSEPYQNPDSGATDGVTDAAEWLASHTYAPTPVLPIIRKHFGLSVQDAIRAIREANEVRREAGR